MGDKDNRAGSQHPCTQQQANELAVRGIRNQQRLVLQLPARLICLILFSLLIPNLCFLPLCCCCSSTSEFTKQTHFHPGLPPVEDTRIMSSFTQSISTSCLFYESLISYHKVCWPPIIKQGQKFTFRGASRTRDIQITYLYVHVSQNLVCWLPVSEPETAGNSDS